MGPPGAVAAVGAIGAPGSGMYPPMYGNQRTSIRFANPARYNFPQGNIYRLRISGIPNRPGKVYYPTLEVYPATPHTVTFLSHNTVPVSQHAANNGSHASVWILGIPRPAGFSWYCHAQRRRLDSVRARPKTSS